MKTTLLLLFAITISVSVFAQFETEQIISTNANEATSVCSADIDGDGDMDVLSASWKDDKVAWYENTDGKGNFGSQQIIATSADGPDCVRAFDLDGDGDMDVLSSSYYDNKIAWYENTDGKGNFSAEKVITTNMIYGSYVYASDLDGDGDLDVLSASIDDDKIAWYENRDGKGTFGPQQVIANPDGPNNVTGADLDNDGDMDVLFDSANGDSISWCENRDGKGNFGASINISLSVDKPSSVNVADIDGDGDLDVISTSINDNKVAWYENTDGKGTFGPQQIINNNANQARYAITADFDNDGDMDIVSASWNDDKIAWYENTDGKGTFGPQQLISINANGASGVYGADFNGDNKVDVVSSSYYDNKIAWYVNNITKVQDDQNGDWTAQHVTLVNTPEAELMVRTGDIDNLGFGWPNEFNPFSGESTPAHSYPWTPDTSDAAGTDRIMVVSSYQYGSSMATDGYTYNTSRPENLPRPIVLKYNLNSINVQSATLQIFVDDFQASVWGAHYFVSINGVKIPTVAKMINSLVQTGPIGKLINVPIPQEYLYLVKQDSISILFDDNTTGAGDGYAIDFVKLLVNLKDYQYKAQIYGFIKDSVSGKPVGNASVFVPGIQSTVSDTNGHYLLNNLPAGINTVSVVTGCYDTATILMDLSANDSTQHNFQLIKSNTIYSTVAGGYWKDTSTWTCGVVPVDTNDVVINGNVILDGYGHACNNLTINKGDTLYNISTSSNNLKIYGNIINHGAVIVKESYTFYPYGDIINNGIWDTYKISLEYGTVDEKIEINGHFTFYMFRINSNVDGAAHYQWYKNGQPISGATGSRYYLHNDEDYAGEYYCKTDAGNSRKITVVKENAGEGTILKEHFDGETFPPAGWTQKITNTANTWMKGNPSNHPFTEIDSTNRYSAICPYVAEDQDEWLKTPAVALPSGTIKLEFYAGYNSSWLSKAIVKLHISTDGGTSWTKLGEADNDGKAWEWRKVSVDLSDYAGQTVMLAWQYVGNDGDLMAIDNVEITQGTTGLSNHYANEEKLKLKNYPNPFSQQTTISFILPERMNVKLEILNIFGQIIDVPVNKVLIAGHYKIVYKPTSGTYGIYFFRLKLNDKTVTRKMVYTK